MDGTRPAARLLRRLLWMGVAAVALALAIFTARAVPRPSHGFVANYAAGRLVLERADAARFTDDAWFAAQVRRYEPTVIDIYGANLPTTALWMTPLGLLEYRTARALWAGASWIALVIVLFWLARRCRLGPFWSPAFIGAGLLFQPVRENLLHAQMYIAVLVLACIAWVGFRRIRPAHAGMPIGLLLSLKTAGLMYWPMLAATRRYRALAWAATSAAILGLASTLAVGPAAWSSWAHAAARLPGSAWLSVTAYQTQTSLIRHLLVRDARWNPEPITHMPAAATLIQLAALATLLGVSCVVAWRRPCDDRVFAGFSALTLILSPVSLDYHYTLALLPLAILLSDLRARPFSAPALLLFAAAALIAADLPYRSPRLATGTLAVLAYPKLYGAYLMWAVALHGAWSARDRRPADAASVFSPPPSR